MSEIRNRLSVYDIEGTISVLQAILSSKTISVIIFTGLVIALALNLVFDYLSILKSFRIGIYLDRKKSKSILLLSACLLLDLVISLILAIGIVASCLVLFDLIAEQLLEYSREGFWDNFLTTFLVVGFDWNDGKIMLLFMLPAFFTTLVTSIWFFLFILAHLLMAALRWVEGVLRALDEPQETREAGSFAAGVMVAIFSIGFFIFVLR